MWRRVHRYIVFKIDEKTGLVAVDKVGGAGESYYDLADSLPDYECRYAIFDFDFVTVPQDLLSLPERRGRLSCFSWH
ncbi:unnamed protein product [Linum tenue]|uniref:ADF-H domain-containing protein n=1 Tax=Linum tenue TaxID=586396 RepID=A0AAV0QMM5_9ROSI|nr:unnamed protein product [Linum tenue]